jgi:hypothetical protein
MARNPEKYPNPTKFMPERHMSKVAVEEPSNGRDDISFAFGFGRRVWYESFKVLRITGLASPFEQCWTTCCGCFLIRCRCEYSRRVPGGTRTRVEYWA